MSLPVEALPDAAVLFAVAAVVRDQRVLRISTAALPQPVCGFVGDDHAQAAR